MLRLLSWPLVFMLFVLSSHFTLAVDCQISYATKSDLSSRSFKSGEISTLSAEVNQALKLSFDFAEKVDEYTFGLASLAANLFLDPATNSGSRDPVTNGTNPPSLGYNSSFVFISDLKPSKWNELTMQGSVLFKNDTFHVTPLRGVKVIFSNGKKKQVATTGSKGEYVEHFSSLIPASRLNLYNKARINFISQNKIIMKLPINVTIQSKQCEKTIKFTEFPLEPIIFFVTNKKAQG
ncbi:MAG: hypothetical protein AAF203_00410 [Pseudomonadota bacterium]